MSCLLLFVDAPYRAYWDGYYGYAWNSPSLWPAGAEVRTNTVVTIETMVYSASRRNVRATYIGGREITVDPADLIRECKIIAKRLQGE